MCATLTHLIARPIMTPTSLERAQTQALTICGIIARSIIESQNSDKGAGFSELPFCSSDVALGCVKSICEFLTADDGVPLPVKTQLCVSVFSTQNIRYLKELLNRYPPQKMAALFADYDKMNANERARVRGQTLAQSWVDSALPKMRETLLQMGYN